MQAKDLMTTDVVVVNPDTPARAVAKVLLDHAISAVPVVDSSGAPVGMVSEGDLIARSEADRDARRDWWLTLLAEGHDLNPDFLSSLAAADETAKDVMAAPVVTVAESAEATEIARLLAAYRIKRVPVVRDGRIVGIVSRADLLKALAAERPSEPAPSADGFIAGAIRDIDRRFSRRAHAPAAMAKAGAKAASDGKLDAADFRSLVESFEHEQAHHHDDERRVAANRQRERVIQLIDQHVDDTAWQDLLHKAREAAERGEKEVLLLRFPSQLCSDGGRAINTSEPDWPKTLRGEAAEIYLRWEHELRPHGFHLTAQVLDFPDGMPGDVGLSLVWGG